MNSPVASHPPSGPRRRILRWFIAAAGLGAVAATVAIVNVITLTRDAAALRDEVFGALGREGTIRVQVSAGPVMLAAIRAGLSFVPGMEPEARLALRSVRRASVGVYQLPENMPAANRVRLISLTDEKMQGRGWRRAVTVNDRENLVLVYLPEQPGAGPTQEVCLAVLNGREAVIVAGVVDAVPLTELIGRHSGLAARF